ncbi:hypothetical protein GpartN1_g3701.t1 [Galdieria partita]|uniref:serine O-acetyltransferase n=1 Tax=Galdieria partita TaxID=83374 RepID=A0A9C7PWU7_9RHOD|nr:hypothetical protein GpartN1_g3701.t1 [Galdieria partita]
MMNHFAQRNLSSSSLDKHSTRNNTRIAFPPPLFGKELQVTGPGFGSPITPEELARSLREADDPLWELIRREAEIGARNEPHLASTLFAIVLNHRSLEDALSFHLASKLESGYFQATQWMELLREAMSDSECYRSAIRKDLMAVTTRDPATQHAIQALLFSKGFHALECYRLANWLWEKGRKPLALYLQSLVSKSFAVDIHPAAKIGSSVFIDHATGVVIGETATVGNHVSMLHNVTLGGTGKETGDRHPKIHDGVLLGAGATVLGNIVVGRGAYVSACSVVLKSVEPFMVVSGVPAKVIGVLTYQQGIFPSFEMDQRVSVCGMFMKPISSDSKQKENYVDYGSYI